MSILKVVSFAITVMIFQTCLAVDVGQATQHDDRQIRLNILKAFDADAVLNQANIEVHVSYGFVTLSGNVKQHFIKILAEKTAGDVPGTRRILNKLNVKQTD